MRIIAGKHRGRKIETPREANVRPTSDFAREGIFNILVHGKFTGGVSAVEGKRVLDVFSGTGALGLEALSRGAEYVTFIDQNREALELARRNADAFHELNACDFIHADATQLGACSGAPFALAFLDPPYSSKFLLPALKRLLAQGWLERGATVIAEHDERTEFRAPEGLETLDERRYGRAIVEILRVV